MATYGVSDLALYTREVVPRRTGNKQHPILDFKQADNFLLAYYAGGEMQPKKLPFESEKLKIESEPGEFNQPIDGQDKTDITQKVEQHGKYSINMGRAENFRIGDDTHN